MYLPTRLSFELQEYIISFLPFEKTLNYPFICKQKYNPKIHTWIRSVIKGHLEVVVWLHVNRTEGCPIWAMNYAAENGRLETVKWLHVNRTEGCKF